MKVALAPSREAFVDRLCLEIEQSGTDTLCQIKGLPGMGKTMVIDTLLKRFGSNALLVIQGFYNGIGEILRDIDRTRSSVRGLIEDVPQYREETEESALEAGLRERNIKPIIAQLPPLDIGDIRVIASERGLQLTDEDERNLLRYSLGVPLLVERILDEGCPVQPERAIMLLASYLRMIDSFTDDIGSVIERVGEQLHEDVPDEVRTVFEHKSSDMLRRVRLERVPRGFPRCSQTLDIYSQWIEWAKQKKDELHDLVLFAPDVVDPSALALEMEVFPDLFDTNCGVRSNSRLVTLCPMLRKFALALDGHFLGTEYRDLAVKNYDLALRASGIGSCTARKIGPRDSDVEPEVTFNGCYKPFYLFSVAHHGDMNNQPGLGLGCQTVLEHMHIPFRLRLGQWKTFDYDPFLNQLKEVSTLQIHSSEVTDCTPPCT